MEVQLLQTFYPFSHYAISCILLVADWDVVEKVYNWFPIRHKDTLKQLNEWSKKLAAFVRGRGPVCLILAS